MPLIRPGGRIQYSDSLQGTPADCSLLSSEWASRGSSASAAARPTPAVAIDHWLKVKTFIESELEILGVQRDAGKPTMALMGEIGARDMSGQLSSHSGDGPAISSKRWLRSTFRTVRREFKGEGKDAVQSWLSARRLSSHDLPAFSGDPRVAIHIDHVGERGGARLLLVNSSHRPIV